MTALTTVSLLLLVLLLLLPWLWKRVQVCGGCMSRLWCWLEDPLTGSCVVECLTAPGDIQTLLHTQAAVGGVGDCCFHLCECSSCRVLRVRYSQGVAYWWYCGSWCSSV